MSLVVKHGGFSAAIEASNIIKSNFKPMKIRV
jgi:hypothetical protein